MKSLIVGILFLLSSPLAAQVGHESGSGGAGMVCRGAGGEISSVDLLDFWEAENFRGLKIKRSDDDILKQVDEAMNTLVGFEQDAMAGFVKFLARALHQNLEVENKGPLPVGVGIMPPRDALTRYKKKGCIPEGIALFDNVYGALDIDPEPYGKLDRTKKAGLYFHEAYYKWQRDRYDVADSVSARAITGCAFAESPCPELSVKMGIPENTKGPLFECRLEKPVDGHSSTFIVWPQGERWVQTTERWRFQLVLQDGILPPARSYFDVTFNGFGLSEGGVTKANLHPLPTQTYKTKSSENRWRNIGIPFQYKLSTVGGKLLINDSAVVCKQKTNR